MAAWPVFQIVSRKAGTMVFEVLHTVKAQTPAQALDKWAQAQGTEGMNLLGDAIERDSHIIQAMPEDWMP